jgi:hypothetical protein
MLELTGVDDFDPSELRRTSTGDENKEKAHACESLRERDGA